MICPAPRALFNALASTMMRLEKCKKTRQNVRDRLDIWWAHVYVYAVHGRVYA
jgi:hypothetical protein